MKIEGRRFLALKWIGPYLLVPVLLIASLVIESRMQESGLIAYIPVGMRSSYSIWRVIMFSSMIGTPVTALFMGEKWKSGESSPSFSGMFLGSYAACFLASLLAMTAASFILLPPLTVPVGYIASQVFQRAAVTSFWIVSTGFLCSAITSGSGAAVLSLGLFSLGLFPGLAGSSMGWWFAAPLGDMVTGTQGAGAAVAGHSAVYLAISLLILKKTTR